MNVIWDEVMNFRAFWDGILRSFYLTIDITQSAGAVEYTDCTSAEE